MKTVVHVVGNRPQFIKLAVLFHELAHQGFAQQIVHTGQHFSYNMSEQFFSELKLPEPAINFNLQRSSANAFIGEAADILQAYFLQQKDIVVFVYGDTNSTLAAAIAAKRCNIELIHFEAGVRTHDAAMPEEINRILSDRLSNVNYCCTENNFVRMQQEGFGAVINSEVLLTGDLMLDAFLNIPPSEKKISLHQEYIAATIHRDANLANRKHLSHIVAALNQLHKTMPVVMPLHPHTKKKLAEYELEPLFDLIEPLGYGDMKSLLAAAACIVTDSGGTSREAYFLKKRSLIIMDHPFWPEIIADNCSLSSSANEQKIVSGVLSLGSLVPDFSKDIFGDGTAAKKIRRHLNTYLDLTQ